MFGIGFTELVLISIIAILFLGPDKLPGALVEMAKFIKSVKKTIGEAKSSLEEEMKISDLKEEALSYKKQLTDATDELKGFKNLSLEDDFDDVTYDDEPKVESSTKKDVKKDEAKVEATQIEPKNETVTLKKKPKKVKDTNKKGDA
jgi:sec-independent protein translocase protein TatB